MKNGVSKHKSWTEGFVFISMFASFTIWLISVTVDFLGVDIPNNLKWLVVGIVFALAILVYLFPPNEEVKK